MFSLLVLLVYPKNLLPSPMSRSFSPLFSSRIFMVSGLLFKSLISLGLISYISDKMLTSKIYEELIQFNNNNKTQFNFKDKERSWIDIFPIKTYKWPTNTRKDAQHHWSSRKCKSKPHWYITSHLLEWLLLKRQQRTSFGKDVEKRDPWCTID